MMRKHGGTIIYSVALATALTFSLCSTPSKGADNAADPKDVKKAIEILKNDGLKSNISGVRNYQMNLTIDDSLGAPIASTLLYQESSNGASALSYIFIQNIGDTAMRTTTILDFEGGRPDGKPDKYAVVELTNERMIKMFNNNDTNFDPYVVQAGFPNKSIIDKYDKAIDNILRNHKNDD